MQRRFTEVFGLMGALGLTEPPDRGPHLACYEAGRHLRGATDEGAEHESAAPAAARHRSTSSCSARATRSSCRRADVVHRIRLLIFSGSHPGIADGEMLTPEEIVDTVLYGLVRRGAPPRHDDGEDAAMKNQLTLTPRES